MARESKKDHKDRSFKGTCYRRRPRLSSDVKLTGMSFIESYKLMLEGDSIVNDYAMIAG